jgi:hypothetical protein
MKPMLILLLALGADAAFAACPERMQRDPLFVSLAVDENAPRPKSVEDFRFIDETTTFDDLTKKVGPPDAAKGANNFIWCLADGTVITVAARDSSDIREVRASGKLVYKRKKK